MSDVADVMTASLKSACGGLAVVVLLLCLCLMLEHVAVVLRLLQKGKVYQQHINGITVNTIVVARIVVTAIMTLTTTAYTNMSLLLLLEITSTTSVLPDTSRCLQVMQCAPRGPSTLDPDLP